MAETLHKIFFEGEVTDEVIAKLLREIDCSTGISKKLKGNLKVVVIELCTNIVSHHSGTTHSTVKIHPDETGCGVEVSSFVNLNDFEIIQKIIEQLRAEENIEEYYFKRMANNPDSNLSAQLGLIRVYKICEGQMQLESELVASKYRLIFKLRINDKY